MDTVTTGLSNLRKQFQNYQVPNLKLWHRRNVFKLYYDELTINGSYFTAHNKICSEINGNTSKSNKKEYIHFQECMCYVLIFGLFLGTNSIYGFTFKDPSALRFTVFSLRFMFLTLITLINGVLSVTCFYVLTKSLTLYTISYLAFYSWSVLIYLSFIKVSVKWPQLAQEVTKSGLSEYLDPFCKVKCNLSLALLMTLATVEHVLSIIGIVSPLIKCVSQEYVYKAYIKTNWNWLFDLGIPFSIPLGIIIQMLTIFATLIQSYSDLFIICISHYLSSIFENINKKVTKGATEAMPPKKWQELREDYNQATRLVRSFDCVVSSLVLLSFASNVFFICFQLFNVIGQGLSKNYLKSGFVKNCTLTASEMNGYRNNLSSGIYIRAVYHVYSVLFLVGRFIAVTLAAAKINNEALAPAVSLYRVPSIGYCKEIERFLEQVNNDTVALSGLNFFYITRGLLLSVIATIITYELVLLQYSDMGSLGQSI